MKGSDIFPSKYIKSDDLNGRDVLGTIERVEIEKLGDDQKLVLYFADLKGLPKDKTEAIQDKGMVCNKTNFGRIAYLYGDETDDWFGKQIVLTSEFVEFQGKTVKGLRVRPPKTSTQVMTNKKMVTESQNLADEMSDDIPF